MDTYNDSTDILRLKTIKQKLQVLSEGLVHTL